MAVYAGRKGVVYMSTTGTGTATNVIKLTEWTLSRNTDKFETSAFGDSNKTYVQGLPDTQGGFSGWFDDSESKIFQGADSADGVKLYLYPTSDAATKYWYGPAWIDYSVTTPMGGVVSVEASFAANGAWGRL